MVKPIRYPTQVAVGITEELRAELERLSEERKESISEIARRGIEAEVARLKA
jgi:predicted transcriptional regulator